MRSLRSSSSLLLAAIALLLSSLAVVRAKPALVPADLHLLDTGDAVDSQYATLLARDGCANPCGFNGWLCCASGAQCYTDSSNQAQCGGATAAVASTGYWEYWTTTWVETDTVTKTAVYSSWVGGSAATPTSESCAIPCGSNCCGSGQYCLIWSSGVCANSGTTPGVSGATTTNPSVAIRPTSTGVVTTTVPFESAVPTGVNVTMASSGGGGLSGGAIAGIVIGTLAGIVLLILICLFCCARALFDAVLAMFGLGKKKRRTHEETYIEEHHHSSGGGRRWYGDRPSRIEVTTEKKSSGLGGIATMGAALGALALALGLKRKHDRRHEDKSDYTSTYYSSDYTSSSSASSSDRHTRRTRDSRHTRDTRRSSRR